MDNIISYLEELNFTQGETKIYLTLAETGAITPRDLAQKLGMQRTQVYPSLDLLIEKGLVMKMIKGSQTHFAITEPKDSLPALIIQKAHNLQEKKAGLPAILVTLEKLQGEKKENDDAEIRYYKGKAGIKKIYREALEAKELRSYVNIGIMYKMLPDNSVLFSEALKTNKELTMYEIIEDSPISREQTQLQTNNADHERYFYKFLPKDIKLFAADTLIYDGKVSIINAKENPTGVVFKNSDYYNNTKQLFDFNWEMLSEKEK